MKKSENKKNKLKLRMKNKKKIHKQNTASNDYSKQKSNISNLKHNVVHSGNEIGYTHSSIESKKSTMLKKTSKTNTSAILPKTHDDIDDLSSLIEDTISKTKNENKSIKIQNNSI